MSSQSKIGWTNASWNPVTGCSVVSPGCVNCYAATLSLRRGWSKKPWTAQNAQENVKLHPDRLDAPLHWRKPRMVFVNSMSDLFHEQIPTAFIARVFAVMGLRNIHSNARHIYQVLTKRPERMLAIVRAFDPAKLTEIALNQAFLAWGPILPSRREWWKEQNREAVAAEFKAWPLPNVWLGVSVEDQRRAEERIPVLLQTPAAVRWISAEPLLGGIDLARLGGDQFGWGRIDALAGIRYVRANALEHGSEWDTESIGRLGWVVVGGESGPGHRPMEVAWAQDIADDCDDAGVPLFVKQDSGAKPGKQGRIPDALWARKAFPA